MRAFGLGQRAQWLGGATFWATTLLTGCLPPVDDDTGGDRFVNNTDKTNGNASFVQSSACRNCHADVAARHERHGHAQMLQPVRDGAPEYPLSTTPGVPDPPSGRDWSDIAFVIGGYAKKAHFVGLDGFLLTNGATGVNSQYNLSFPVNGTQAGFVAFETGTTTNLPYGFECFRCHATGPEDQDPARPESQENRPGILGTFSEAGVQCEACHGPGSGHFATSGGSVIIDRSRVFTDPTGAQTCNTCHSRPFDSPDDPIPAADGFILNYAQVQELRASGGHAAFGCTTCHDPHRSVYYDRDLAIRNECTACHADMNMALHDGLVLTRGNYAEMLSCESCHMPYATRAAANAGPDVAGVGGRIGDTRSHIFRISTAPDDYTAFFSDDQTQVRLDEQGLAAVTVDFVCLRCHNGVGVFALTVERAAEIAGQIHGDFTLP